MSNNNIFIVCIAAILTPLFSAILIGFLGTGFRKRPIGPRQANYIAIFSVFVSLTLSSIVFLNIVSSGSTYDFNIYLWNFVEDIPVEMGILIDSLSSILMVLVNVISLVVHIYSIAYMRQDDSYQRFFSYISLFVFFMLVLILSNNMMQLFFGWEGVGLASYLLIGFWYKKPSAISANLKAFLVNRVSDLFFILGIILLFSKTNTLSYQGIFDYIQDFSMKGERASLPNFDSFDLICLFLLIGAMGKSAQFPMHVWLPDSMEGPTPISALIHSATMVTAGIFLIARLSPVFELSDLTLSSILVVGSINIVLLGILGIFQEDIKRIIAYSTLSQLGYMFVALGASAYPVAIFHLITHAFFKALLFLCAGSLIIGMHHNQNIYKMGRLRKYMPVTWITFLIGTLSLVGTPFFSGFYSKESIIEAVKMSSIPGSGIAYYCCLSGILITSIYSFRLYFLVFHGRENFRNNSNASGELKPHESPLLILFPLILLSIFSVFAGIALIEPILFSNFFKHSILIDKDHLVMFKLAEHWINDLGFSISAIKHAPLWLTLLGMIISIYFFRDNNKLALIICKFTPLKLKQFFRNNYYVDWVYEIFIVRLSQSLGYVFWKKIDYSLIDKSLVNSSINLIGKISSSIRKLQSGHIHWYALSMVIGVTVLLFILILAVANELYA